MELAHEQKVQALLAPLARVEPVERRRRRRVRTLPAIALATTAMAFGGVALGAAGLGPLAGIGSADRPRSEQDVVSPSVTTELGAAEPPGGRVDQIGKRLADAARLVGTLPSGRRVYAVPTTKGKLCIVVENLAGSCSNPLTAAEPITLTMVDPDGIGGVPPVLYGVARDGVTAVSFTVSGRPIVVPVRDNFYAYQGRPFDGISSFSSVTIVRGG